MANNSTKITHKQPLMLSLISENEVESEMGEAFASFMLNPTVTWAKFVLTDDRTNGNGERVPKEEFPNLIRSGIHMPIKMVGGEIKGHPDSSPLGAITHLKQIENDDGSSAIVALAALWGQERPADVDYIKHLFAEKKPVDVSWEILFEDTILNTETNSIDLHGTVLRAATIVSNPAYEGRTPFLAVASNKAKDAKEDSQITDNKNSEDNSMDVKDLEARIAELEPKYNDAVSENEKLTAQLAEKDAEIARLTEENTAKETELVPLREFKEAADAALAKAEKLDTIKTKFVEAGLDKGDEYFTENAEKFLKMDDDSLDFFIQEMVANLSTEQKSSIASKKTKIPALTGEDTEDLSVQGLAKYLRERKEKK